MAWLWKEDVDITILYLSKGHISAVVCDGRLGSVGYLFGFYGSLKTRLRHYSWDLLRRLSPAMNLLWIVFGDFNESSKQMANFSEVIHDLNLYEIKGNDPFYTWSNKTKGR